MERRIFIKRLQYIGISQRSFAKLVGYNYQTVKQWKDGKIPQWVPIVLDHIEMLKKNEEQLEKYEPVLRQ